MMVTFVAQCEKKSLNKTRRVLDAFANRIGSRTWQTVITLEGLKAVKKLLRKTASKNTAVSCHWIRSRSRSELVWIVGNRNKFNIYGYFPVNYTDGELFMDEIEVKTGKIFANTKNQSLTHHLFAVGYVAYQIIQQFVDDEMLAKAVFVAGCLHDLGKIDLAFQEWLTGELNKKKQSDLPSEGQHIEKMSGKFSFENHPRHNEISLLLYFLLNDGSYKKINKPNKNRIKHLLYWHHAKPIRKTEFKKLDTVYKKLKKNIGDGNFKTIFQTTSGIIRAVDNLTENYFENIPLVIAEGLQEKIDDDRIYELDEVSLPTYKRYADGNDDVKDYLKNIRDNAKNNLARAAVITADRLVSALSGEQLINYITEKKLSNLLDEALMRERGLKTQIQGCLDGFNERFSGSDRNRWQAEAAESLTKVEAVGVLNGAAGCGKTKIALEWAVNTNAKKIIWICPRVQVCQGLIKDLTSGDYLPKAKVEINTGEFKFIYQDGKKTDTPEGQEFSGDVVITTIDQITNAIITHRTVTSLVTYMSAHVVFDEFHEYINMPALNLLFAELVQCKRLQEDKARILLVSATPNYYFVEEFLGIDQQDIIGIESFNKSQYQISFISFDESKQDESNPLYQSQVKNTFVISNTAITAQRSFIDKQNSEKSILLHSKFKKEDKEKLFDKVVNSFMQNGTHEHDILRSGPVVQASLNISCDHMVTEFTHAENWLQRLGRLDRFGENNDVSLYVTAIPKTLAEGKQNGACARFLNSLNSLQSAKKWYEFLTDKISDQAISIAEIYQLYQEFYQDDSNREAIEQDFIKALKKSVGVINNKVIDPVSIPRKKKLKDSKVKIKKHSLRGDNRFVQMAICQISNRDNIEFPNEYAYPEADPEANLTTSVELICGYGDSKQNLLAFMAKKHHNIKDTKKSYKDKMLLNEARSPEAPVYLSYIPNDLKKVEAQPHPKAIYYAMGNRQPIGAISIDQLIIKGE
ncbi:MAG: CRISPR-associated endonuclease Cas3'' [Thermodesulfobacteriota bacterium]|nr:CRISPR-associated endonuclease Cas3'' [Thermodesulfobacteriota bacterium]